MCNQFLYLIGKINFWGENNTIERKINPKLIERNDFL